MGIRTGARQTLIQKVAETIPVNCVRCNFVQVQQPPIEDRSWEMN